MNMVRKIAENINTSPEFVGKLQYNISMKEHTTFKIGGPAEIFITPKTVKSFCFVIHYLQQNKQSFFILGKGSNIVVSEKGISGFVISTAELNTIKYNTDTNELICGAGCSFASLTQFCIKNSLSGLEVFAGLPASIGGAIFMNARCYEISISDIITSVEYVTKSGMCKTYSVNLKDWDYKVSPFKNMEKGTCILATHFKVHKENKKLIKETCKKYIKNRLEKGHYKFPSAGSVFKNNRTFGKPTGQLIDEAGLKGTRCGGAQIAPWHGNFIVNTGNATADDIKKLVDKTSQIVK